MLSLSDQVIKDAVDSGYVRVDAVGEIYGPKKRLKQSTHRNGYLVVEIKGCVVLAHRVVAYSLYGDALFSFQVHHKDENKHNNHPDNLILVTPSENQRYSLYKRTGELSGSNKLSRNDVAYIRNLYDLGYSENTIAEKFSISRRQINNIVKNRHWKEGD